MYRSHGVHAAWAGVARAVALAIAMMLVPTGSAHAQDQDVTRVDLPTGRSYPITFPTSVSKVSVANPEVADAIVMTDREVVVNAASGGETDVIVWLTNGTRQHYRFVVRSPAGRMQIALSLKFAEVRRDVLSRFGVSALYRNDDVRVGTGVFRSDNVFDETGRVLIPGEGSFLSVLTDFDTDDLLAFIEVESQRGNARILAEPRLLAGNKEEANFLAGGELPIPIAQAGAGGDVTGLRVTIMWREFGVRLRFMGEIISDSLVKLAVRPEVSTLDYGNAIIVSGFRIPALRTRRVETTVDVKRDQSLVISGLFNDERERVRTGIPFLMDIPILGNLFSSTRWQHNESELLVVVTPTLVDPLRPRPQDVLPVRPDTALPAREVIRERLQPSAQPVRRP